MVGRRRLLAVLVVMCTSLGLVVGANSSLSVAQPNIAAAIGATQTQLTWVINAYALAFAALLLPAGIAADKYGRRVAMVAGLAVFAAASIVSGLVTVPQELIALRVVAGVGATFVMPATLSVLVDSYPEDRRDFAVGVWAGVTGAGALLGVLLSGVLLHYFWWGSIQVVYGAAAVTLLPLVYWLVPNTADRRLPLDLRGGVLAAVGLAGVVYGVIQGPDQGWTAPLTVTALGVGVIGVGGFVVAELRSDDPMLDVRLFRSRGLAAGSLLVLLLSLAVFGFFLLGPQFLQFVGGYDPLGAALRLLPFAVGIAPGSQLSPRFTASYGARTTSCLGTSTMACGLLIFAVTAHQSYWLFAVGLVVTAFGMGMALTAGTTLILQGLPADRRTLSSAVNDVTREVGSAIGAAVMGSVLVSMYGHRITPALTGLPAPVAHLAHDGVGTALAVARAAGPGGDHLATAARDGFTRGYQGAMLLGAVILLMTAALIGMLAPPRPPARHRRLPSTNPGSARTHRHPGRVSTPNRRTTWSPVPDAG